MQPAINATAPVIGMALEAESKNPAVGEKTSKMFNSLGGGKILGLTVFYGKRLCSKVMWI